MAGEGETSQRASEQCRAQRMKRAAMAERMRIVDEGVHQDVQVGRDGKRRGKQDQPQAQTSRTLGAIPIEGVELGRSRSRDAHRSDQTDGGADECVRDG